MGRKSKKAATGKSSPPRAASRVATLERELAKALSELERARQRNPPPSEPPKSLSDMPSPPADPLEAQAYAYRMLMESLHNAAKDPKISERERRKEMRTIAASAAKLLPRVRVYQAEQLILADRAELEKKTHERQWARLEPEPA